MRRRRRPSRTLGDRHEAGEGLEVVDEDVVPVGRQVAPGRAVGGRRRGSHHQAEVLRLPVGADDEPVAQVLDGVLVIAFARQEEAERLGRPVGVEQPDFGVETVLCEIDAGRNGPTSTWRSRCRTTCPSPPRRPGRSPDRCRAGGGGHGSRAASPGPSRCRRRSGCRSPRPPLPSSWRWSRRGARRSRGRGRESCTAGG